MKAIYRMNLDFGRMGDLEGTFTATKQQVEKLTDGTLGVYWGELLGKHSEVYGNIEPEDMKMLSDNPEVVEVFEKYDFSSGYNPFYQTAYNFNYEAYKINEHVYEVGDIIDEIIKKENK